jgi:hypothetical protein
MSERNKPIAFLSAKLDVVLQALKENSIIQNATIECLAKEIDVSASTLKSQRENNAISLDVESKICSLATFLRTDPAWCDENVDKSQRLSARTSVAGYMGNDTVVAFRNMLRQRLSGADRYRAEFVCSKLANRSVGHHELEDSGQAATLDTSLPLFLDAYFGPFKHNGIKYGFRLARLEIDLICNYGSKTQAQFAVDEAVPVKRATLLATGTARSPAWQIAALESEPMLEERVATKDDPLMALIGFQEGTVIRSRLIVDPHDGVLSHETEGALNLSGNQQAIIEMLSVMALSDERRPDGKIELSFYEHKVTRLNSVNGGEFGGSS